MNDVLHAVIRTTALVVALGGATAPATAASTEGSLIAWNNVKQSWVGNWSCTYTATDEKGEQTWSMIATRMGTKWIKFAGKYPATKTEPADPFEIVYEYDETRHQWVNSAFNADGSYSMSKSTASPGAMTSYRNFCQHDLFFNIATWQHELREDEVAEQLPTSNAFVYQPAEPVCIYKRLPCRLHSLHRNATSRRES